MELLDKGKHCEEEYCHQLDLLPMKCKACNRYYCSDHFKYTAHNCSESSKFNYKIPTCELCNQTIEFKRGHDLDMCLAQHMQKCQFNDKKSSSKSSSKCNFKNCKSKETFQFECERCFNKYCTKHRIPEVHDCSPMSCSKQVRTKGNSLNGIFKTFGISSF